MEEEEKYCSHISCLTLFECHMSIKKIKEKFDKELFSAESSEVDDIIKDFSEAFIHEEHQGEVKCKFFSLGSEKSSLRVDFIEAVQFRIKNISECMSICGSLFKNLSGQGRIQKDLTSLSKALIVKMKSIFKHCKESSRIYGGYFPKVSADLSVLFKSTYQALKSILEHLEKVSVSDSIEDEEALDFASIVMELLEIILVLKDIDLLPLMNTFRSLNRIISSKNESLHGKLDIQRLFSAICICTKEKLGYCYSLIKEAFYHPEAGDKCAKLIKILRFLVGMLLQLIKQFSKDIFGEATEAIIDVMITLQSMTSTTINTFLRGFSLYEDFCSSVLSVIEPMIIELLEERDFVFAMRSSQEKRVGNETNGKLQNLSMLLIYGGVLGALSKSSDSCCELWMKEHICSENYPSLVDLVFNQFNICLEDNLDSLSISSSVGTGKPQRDVSLYEYTYVRICAFISTIPSAQFYTLEQDLMRHFFSSSRCSLLAEDCLAFIARWGGETICFELFNFFLLSSFVIFKVSSIGCGYYKKASKILRRFFNLMPDAKKETLFESFQPCKPENIHIWLSVDINILGSKIKDKLLKSFIPSSLKSLEEYKTNGDARLLKLTLKAWENCLRADDSLGLVSPIHRTAVIDILMEAFNAFRTGECSDLDEDFFCLLFNSVGNVIQHIEEIQIQEVFQVVDSLLKNNTSELLQLSCCRFLSASKFIQFSTASQTQPGKLLSQLFSHLLTSKSFFIRRGALKSLKEFAEVTSHPEVVCDSLQDSMSDAFSMFLKQEFILDRLDDEQKEARLSGAFEGTGKANVQAHMLANDLQPKTPIMELREEVNEIGITQNEIENEMSSTKDKDLERAILEIREYLNNTNVLPEIATNLKLLARDINKAFEN